MDRQVKTSWPIFALSLVLISGLGFGAAAFGADRRDVRVSFEKEQERLDRDERALHKTLEADKKALNERCDREGRALHEKYRREQRRLERELDALHDRCRQERRALDKTFESRKRTLNDRRETLRREYHHDVRDSNHPGPPPAAARGEHFEPAHQTDSKGLPPGLERYEEKHGGKLPPGLQKQLEQKGKLPPGLEKR